MNVGISAACLAGAAILLGCTERGPAATSTTAAASAPAPAPSPVATAPSAPKLPPPTRTMSPSGGDMHYHYWEPAVSVADLGADPRARATAVLATPEIRELLGAAAVDGFVYEKSTPDKHMVTFRQTRAFRGEPVIVDGAYATVELADDTKLAYLGTGFRGDITLADGELAVDEARAGTIALAAYEAQEKFAGKVTPHLDPGLRVQDVRNSGWHLVYEIHVERAAGQGHPRPFMFVVDAQSGAVVRSYQAWVP